MTWQSKGQPAVAYSTHSMIPFLDPDDPDAPFPELCDALDEPNGLLAAGGDLSPRRLIHAYRRGIYPWFNEDQPILWWSPAPRAVLFPEEFHLSKSLAKTLRKGVFQTTLDAEFRAVITACGGPNPDRPESWIDKRMIEAYCKLHTLGYAHSVEVYAQKQLVGGLYGIALGKVFFGESMFSVKTDASKVALATLVDHLKANDFQLIDCQMSTSHLASLGARDISRDDFRRYLLRWCPTDAKTHWESA